MLKAEVSRTAQLTERAATLGAVSVLRHSLRRWALKTEVTAANVAMHRHLGACGRSFSLWRAYAARRVWQQRVLEDRRQHAAVRVLRAWHVVAAKKRTVRRALREVEEKLRIRLLRHAMGLWREPGR